MEPGTFPGVEHGSGEDAFLLPESGSSRGTLLDVEPDTVERPRTPWLDVGKTGRTAIPLRMPVRPQRIRTYLVLFALALSLPLLCVSVFGLHRMASIEESQTDSRILAFAKNLAVDVDKELDRAIVTLEALANSSELRSGDLRGFHKLALIAFRPKKAAIVLLDKSYRQLVDTLTDYGTALPATADPATAMRVVETGRPQVSGVFKGSINGLYVFNVEIPVFDADRQVQYVLIMSFQASHISDILKQIHYPPGWVSGVTDQNGIILARSDRPEEYVGTPLPTELFERTAKAGEGVYQATNVAGIPILRSTARSKHAGWYVSLAAPLSFVQAPRWRSYAIGAAALGTAVVLGWALAYYFGLLMARPLDEATRIAKSVSQSETIEATTTPLVEANILVTLAEASAELRSQTDHATYLMRELAHRAKNQLAVVKGMAVQTARRSPDVSQFIVQFDRRIQGLAQSQDVLLRQNWRGAWLFDLVRAHLELFGISDRVRLEGPNVLLNAAAVQNLGFALHELATNAVKHGALSVPSGEILIRSSIGDDAASLSWIETGGPPVHDPPNNGFGYRVITELVPRALNGSTKLEFAERGIRWQQEIPSSNILTGGVQRA